MRGGCLCGAVHFEVNGPMRPVIACHCNQCRKSSGHYVAATSARRHDVDVRGHVTWYQSSGAARRGFCGRCGSNLFWDGVGANLSIHMGCLDTPSGLELAGHIYCADKGDYYEIEGDLPQAAQADSDLTTRVT